MKETFVLRQPEDRKIVVDYVSHLDLTKPVVVTFEEKVPNRSKAQNRLYWMWLREIGWHIFETQGKWFDPEKDLHPWFREEFLPIHVVEVGGIIHRVRPSTSKLSVKEFAQYLELIEWFVADSDELQLVLSRPDGLYVEALLGTEKQDKSPA